MITVRQINRKSRPHYFFNDKINIKDFNPDLLSIDKISFKSTDDVINHIEYLTIKSLDNKNIDSANSLYLIFNNVDGYIECNSTEKSNEDKYLILVSTEKNKAVLQKHTDLWDEIKSHIETINCGKPIEYGRDFMKTRFESDDDLALGKILSFSMCVIVVGSAFKRDNNYYPRANLHECLYEYDNSYSTKFISILQMITFEKTNLNHFYYFFNNIKNIDTNLLSIDKKCMKNTDAVMYEIKYIMIQSINNQNIDRKIPLCLSFSNVDAYIIE